MAATTTTLSTAPASSKTNGFASRGKGALCKKILQQPFPHHLAPPDIGNLEAAH